MENTTDPRDLLADIADILEELGIRYVVTGGMAVVVWGRPRYTADIDTVVEMSTNDVDKLAAALRKWSNCSYSFNSSSVGSDGFCEQSAWVSWSAVRP